MSKEVSEEKSNEEIKKEILKLLLSTGEVKTASDVTKMFSELQGKIYQDLLDAEFEAYMKENKNGENKKMDILQKNQEK